MTTAEPTRDRNDDSGEAPVDATGGSTAHHATVNDRDTGPYSIKDMGEGFVDDLRAEINDPNRDHLPVWTRSLIFRAPADSTVTENVMSDTGMTVSVSVDIPEYEGRSAMNVTMSVLRSTDETKLWADIDSREAHNDLEDTGRRVMRRTPWGVATGVESPDPDTLDVHIVGADGPGWSVRALATGAVIGAEERALIRDMVASAVVVPDYGAEHHYPMMVDIIYQEYGEGAVTDPEPEPEPEPDTEILTGVENQDDSEATTRVFPAVEKD